MPRNKNPVKMGIVWGNALTMAFFNICVVFPIFSSFPLLSSPTPVWCSGCHSPKATHSFALSDTFPVKSKTEDPHHAFRFIPSALYKMDVFCLHRVPQTTRVLTACRTVLSQHGFRLPMRPYRHRPASAIPSYRPVWTAYSSWPLRPVPDNPAWE